MNKKNIAGEVTIPVKTHYRVLVRKPIWHVHETDMWTSGAKLKTQR